MSVVQQPPVVLVDGSSYLFRAYYAMPPLTNAAGQPTGAIYGVMNMLRRLIKDYQPENLVVVFDPKGKTTRHEWFADYKANRAVMPDDLQSQIEPLHALIRSSGFPLLVMPGIEADDLIGTLSRQWQEQGQSVLISTGDKDMAQLVNERVKLINTMNNQLLDTQGVEEKFGVCPEQIIDYLALMGDTSDNIPGVPKVGPKTAVKWLAKYGSLGNIATNAEEIKGKVGEYLREALASEALTLSKKLVTIDCYIPIDVELSAFKMAKPDKTALRTHFSTLEFSSWLAEVDQTDSVDIEPSVLEVDYQTILTEAAFVEWLNKLKQAKVFALDTETSSLDAMEAELVGLSFSIEKGVAVYVPLQHGYSDVPSQLDLKWVLQQLQPVLQDSNKTIVGQNLKYDIEILRHYGVTVSARLFDTMLASYVIHQTSMRHDMDTLAKKCLNMETLSFEDVAGKGAKQITFDQVDIATATTYAAEDADVTLRLYHYFLPQLTSSWATEVFYKIEMPVMPVLAAMEYTGVRIDAAMLKQQSADLAQLITSLEQQVYSLAGEDFNISSPKQLRHILFEKLALPVLKKTPKGEASTAEEVLQQLSADYPLPKLIVEYRGYTKLKSTYTDRLPEQINPKTQRVHTHYNQTVTATGRLSSNNPNLQNIPVRNAIGRKIRQAFIARPGRKILAADYSQVELRIMAHLSQDPSLLKAFKNNDDVHSATAAEVFGVAISEVSAEQRRRAKAINFGLMYGMSAFGLARQLGIPRNEAQTYIDVYFDRYPQVKNYMEQARERASAQGYVETLTGRRLYTPEINTKNVMRRRAAERAAINAPLQGSAADIIKLAMIDINKWLPSVDEHVSLLMQVHDELVFSVDENQVEDLSGCIRELMQNPVSLSVDLLVEIGVGDSWEAAH